MELINFFFELPAVQFFILTVKVVGPVFFLLLLGLIIFCLAKSPYVQLAFWQDIVELKSQRAYGAGKVEKKWAAILKRLQAGLPADWKLAVIEAETLTDEVLSRMGFSGESFGERLKKISQEQLPSLDDLMAAHQIRQNIIHDPDYRLELDLAQKTVNTYGRCLQEFGAL